MRASPLLLALAGWALFGAAGGGGDARADGPARPRIVFEKKDENFGQVVLGAPVERVFRFKNAGQAPLHVRRVKPSCGCTAALLTKAEVAPGDTGEIQVRFDSTDRLGFAQIQVEVYSDDDQEREGEMLENTTVLRLSGEVVSLLSVIPPTFYFPNVQRGTPASMTVTVLAADVAAVSATALECSNPALRVTLGPFVRGDRRGFAVTLAVPADQPVGRIDGIVTVRTDHPRQPAVTVRVIGQVNGRFVTFPNRLQLFPHEGGEKETSISILRIAGEGPIEVAGVEAPPFLEARPDDVVPGKRTEVAVRLKAGVPPGPVAGVLRIFLRDPEQPLVEVSVTGEVARRVTISPPAVYLAGRTGEGAGAAPVTLRVAGGKVLAAAAEGAPVVATVEAPDRVRVALATGAKDGPIAGRILLKTDVPGEETIEIAVRGEVARASR